LGGRGRQISEFEASLVYKVSSRTARATQRNPVWKKKKKKTVKTVVSKYYLFIIENNLVDSYTYCDSKNNLTIGSLICTPHAFILQSLDPHMK
jgi:methyltransferase-like protein